MNNRVSSSLAATENQAGETAAEVPGQAGEADLIASLRLAVGQDYVLTNQEACEFYSHDVFLI